MNKKLWKNKNGEYIDIDSMNSKYLLNIKNYVERKAKEGVNTYINIGSDTDSYYKVIEKSDTLYGDGVRALYKNYDYVLERLSLQSSDKGDKE